jgi:serine protease AprX
MPSEDPPQKPEPGQIPDPVRQEERAQTTHGPLQRTLDIRLDMMRSIVTEPLMSKVIKAVREENDMMRPFEVIISLNETFTGGIAGAMHWVTERARQWKVTDYTTVSHYVFACLTAEQILELAEEARTLIKKYGQTGTVVYRIWEDTEISTTLTHSLTTVKADAAQRAFQAQGDGIVWAVLDSGIDGAHEE